MAHIMTWASMLIDTMGRASVMAGRRIMMVAA